MKSNIVCDYEENRFTNYEKVIRGKRNFNANCMTLDGISPIYEPKFSSKNPAKTSVTLYDQYNKTRVHFYISTR